MITHGAGKAQMVIDGATQFPDPLGMGAETSLLMAALTEFGCAILVILGFATRFSALGLAFTMGVAAFVIHADDPWLTGGGKSKEPALLYMIPFLALVFTGPGRFALDHLIAERWRARRANK